MTERPAIMVPALRGQRQIWLKNQLSPASVPAYVKETFLEIEGPLDPARLAAALEVIVARQPALRADLVLDGRELHQRLHPAGPLRLAHHEAAGQAGEGWRAVTGRLFDEFVAEFRFDRGALIEWHLVASGPERNLLYVLAHHAVWDAHTSNLFVRALFDAYVHGRAPADASAAYATLAAEDARYAASGDAESDVRYFVEQLPRTQERARWLRAAPAEEAEDYAVSEVRVGLDPAIAARVRESFRGLRGPPLAVIASAVIHLLRYFGRTGDQVLAMPFGGREHAMSKASYGCFVNPVLFHAAADPRLSFAQTVQRVASSLAEVHRHQRAPLDRLYGALDPSYRGSGPPPFLNFKDLEFAELRDRGVVFRELEVPKRYMDYPININVLRAKDYELRIEHNRHDVDARMAERLGGQLRHLLEVCLSHPQVPIQELAIDEALSVEILGRANATGTAFMVDDAPIFERVRTLAADRGEAPAVYDAGETWSTARLVSRAEAYADAIARAGGAAGDRVAMLLPRSADAIAAMLGILACGCVIVPLDAGAPIERLRGLFDECGVRVYVAAADLGALHRGRELRRASPGEGRAGRAASIHHPHAYILYTSGSSGRPKGVIGTSRGIWNRIQWQWRAFPFADGEVAAHKTGLFWVDSIAEIFAPLLAGVPLAVVRDDQVQDLHAFLDLLEARAVTRIVLVPSLMRVLCEVPGAATQLRALRTCTLSGEALTGELVAKIRGVLPRVQIQNLYGMTEGAGDSTAYVVGDAVPADVPIGRPIDNTQVHVLDEHLAPCPVGIPGEIFIGGAGLAEGYAGAHSTEHDRFQWVDLPAAFGGRARLYRTGDLGAVTPAGELVYLGRKDRQLKIRGMRVDPAEIEGAAKALPGVRDAVAFAPPGRGGTIHLFYQARRGAFVLPGVIEAHVRSLLPPAIVPGAFVQVGELPRLPNGKIDLATLAASAPPAPAVTAAPDNDTERALAAMWMRILKLEAVPVDRTFYDLGGNSLLALEMAVALERGHGIKLGANRLVMRTIREVAGELARKAAS